MDKDSDLYLKDEIGQTTGKATINAYKEEIDHLKGQIEALSAELGKSQQEISELRQSASHYNIFIENSRDVMAIVSLKGIFQFITPNLKLLLGFGEDDVINHSLYNINIYPEDASHSLARFHIALTTGKKQTGIEYRTLHKDGCWRWLSTDISPLLDETGQIASFLVKSIDITERKKVEETLISTESFYKALINKAPDGVVLVGAEGTFTFASPSARRLFGFEVDEPIMVHPSDCTHPDDLPRVLSALGDIIHDPGLVPVLQYRYRHKNGSWLWVESTFSNLLNEPGVNAIVINFRDITERKKAELSLQESTRKLDTIINNLKGVVYRCKNDRDWTMEYISEGIFELTGYPATDFINNAVRTYNSVIHPDDRELVWKETDKDNETHRPFTYEYRIVTADGKIRWVWERGYAIYHEEEIIALEGYISDVTDRRLAYDALKESEEKYHVLIETMSEAVVYVDNDDVILYINQRCCDLYGYKVEELIGKRGYEYLIHPDDQHVILQKNNSRLTGRVDSYEIRALKRTGEMIWLKVSGAPIRDKENRVIGSVGIMSDITAQKSLEEQLLASQKMEAIGQLAGGVAHDFNNLLTVILGYSEELCLDLLPDSKLSRDAEEIFKAGKRAASLTHQLLTFSRKQVTQPKILDLNILVINLNNMLLRLIGEHIDILTVLPENLAYIKADPGQIEQVIVNLVVNSRDAMPTGGKITIESAVVSVDEIYAANHINLVPGQYVMLAISDTGCGMDKELQSRMFDPFFTTKTKGSGLGLGLSTVYGIIRQSDGHIYVYSEIGKGTTVKILFPATTESLDYDEETICNEDLLGKGESILIVEDEESVCQLISRTVSKLGYNVSVGNSGSEALALVESGLNPDLIITDVVMPGMNGKELADLVRKLRPDQKVLFMSGFTDNAIVHHGVLDQDIPFIQKPFSSNGIAQKIKQLMIEPLCLKKSYARILMLDDDENVRMFVKRICKKRGHEFQEAGNPGDAISILAQHTFDVILVDLNLDGLTGEEALQQIRAAGFDVPAIALSGAISPDDVARLKPLGVVKAMEKSFDNLPLIQFIEGLICNK